MRLSSRFIVIPILALLVTLVALLAMVALLIVVPLVGVPSRSVIVVTLVMVVVLVIGISVSLVVRILMAVAIVIMIRRMTRHFCVSVKQDKTVERGQYHNPTTSERWGRHVIRGEPEGSRDSDVHLSLTLIKIPSFRFVIKREQARTLSNR